MIHKLRKLFAAFVIFCLVMAVLDLIVDNPYSQKFFVMQINKLISKDTNLIVTFESLDVNIIPLEVNLFGIQVKSETDKDANLQAIQLKIKISISSLFLDKPKIKLVHIDGLNVFIPHNFQGNILKKNVDLKKKPNPLSWPVKKMTLENAQIILNLSDDPSKNTRMQLAGLNTTVNFKDLDSFISKFTLDQFNFASEGKTYFHNTKAEGEMLLDNDRISLSNFHITDRHFSFLSGWNGRLFLKKNEHYLRLDGQMNLTANLEILERLLDWKDTHGGATVRSKVFINIPFSKPKETTFEAEGTVKAFDGYLQDIRIHDSTSNFSATNNGIKFKDTRLVIDKKEHAHLEGTLNFTDKVDYNFNGRVWDLSLSQIVSSFGPKFDVVDFKVFSDNISFGGTGSPYDMHLKGQVELANLDFPPLKINRDQYPRTPHCYANLNLKFSTQRLHFQDTDTLCFLPPERYIPNAPKNKNYSLPSGALFPSRIQIREYIDFDEGPHFTLSGSQIDLGLGQSFLQLDMGGTTEVLSRIYETKGNLSITNTFSSRDLTIKKIPYGNLKGTLNVLDHSLEWKNVEGGDGIYQVYSKDGFYDWKEDILSFHAKAQNVPKLLMSESLTLFNNPDLNKVGFSVKDIDGHATIPLLSLPDTQLDLRGDITDLTYDGKDIFQELRFKNSTKNRIFTFNEVEGRFGEFEWKGELTLKKKDFQTFLHDHDELDVHIASRSQSKIRDDFKNLPFLAEYLTPHGLSGQIDLDAKFKGPLSQLNGHFDLKLHHVSTFQYPLYSLNLKGFLNKSQVQIYANQPGDSLLGRLDMDLSKKEIPFKWTLNFKQFDLRPFTPTVFNKDARNYAYLSAEWSWAGNFQNIWKSKGFLQLDSFDVGFFPPTNASLEPLIIKSDKPARILMTEQGWSLANKESFRIFGEGTEIEMKLKDSRPPHRMGLFVNSTFHLSSLPKLSPLFQSGSGNLYMESSLDGPVDKMKFKSHLYSKKPNPETKEDMLSVSVTDLSPAFQDMVVDIIFENEMLFVQEFSARKGKGSLRIDGHHDIANLGMGSNLRLIMNQLALDLSLPYLKTVHVTLDGNLILSGKERPYKLDGNVKIARAQTDKFLDLEGEILKEYSAHRIGTGFQEEKKPLLLFNLAIDANKSIEIKSRSLTTTLSTSLSLKGTSEKPTLSGLINVDKGKFRYKRDFVITHGEMIFDNPLRNDPKLNIIAKAQVGTYVVTIYISGDSSKPLVDILVDPSTKDDGSPISRLDAIVLLSTGRLPQIESRSQDARGIVVSTGLNLYASQLPFDKFNELTGQKFISPYVNYTTDEQGNPVPQLNVPLHISDFIEAIIQTIPNKTSATVQVPLHDNISVSGSASSIQRTTDSAQENYQTQSGVDLKFTFPFK